MRLNPLPASDEDERICGGVNCSGTSHVGDEPRKKWNNVAGAENNPSSAEGG